MKMTGAIHTEKLADDHPLVLKFWRLCQMPRTDAEHDDLMALCRSYDDLAKRRYWFLVHDRRLLLRDLRPDYDEVREVAIYCARFGYRVQWVRLFPTANGWETRDPKSPNPDKPAKIYPNLQPLFDWCDGMEHGTNSEG